LGFLQHPMSLFSQCPSGIEYKHMTQLGIDCAHRRGGRGKTPQQSAVSKSESYRAIRDGFGIYPVSNVNLILSRGRPKSARPHSDAAGSVSPERRRLDMPEALRAASVEHQLHRRRSAPPVIRDSLQGVISQLSSCRQSAKMIGRGSPPPISTGQVETPPDSPRMAIREDRRQRSPEGLGTRYHLSADEHSPCRGETPRSPIRPRPVEHLPIPVFLRSTFRANPNIQGRCWSWGDSCTIQHVQPGVSATSPKDLADLGVVDDVEIYDFVEGSRRKTSSGSRCSDDRTTIASSGRSVLSPSVSPSASSPTGMLSVSTLDSQGVPISRASVNSCGDTLISSKVRDKQFAHVYERRIQNLVRAAQRRSIKRIGI